MTPLQRFVSDHTFILAAAGTAAGIGDPVAVDLDDFATPVLAAARRGAVVPLDGVLIRDWDPDARRTRPGLRFGVRLYDLDGVRFARAFAGVSENLYSCGYDFFAVDRADYARFYRRAVELRRAASQPGPPPVLPAGVVETLRRNTVDFLTPANLTRIRALGGRPKRGLLLVGPPGNGKTSACRWVWQQCLAAGLEYRFVSPDDYRAARAGRDAAAAVRRLFQFDTPGVAFFDDMDVAVRNRDHGYESDDQAVFLGAMDGIAANEGVAYVFTTNCAPDLIDPAIRRPGRIDAIVHFPPPDAALRRLLVGRWHADVRAGVDADAVVRETDGLSFAEIDELKNLLVMRFIETGQWEWRWAVDQFERNRRRTGGAGRPVGFAAAMNGAGRH